MKQQAIMLRLAIPIMSLVMMCFASTPGVGEPIESPAAVAQAGSIRIQPAEVSLSNLTEFEDQLREDLPVGTSKQEAAEFLEQLGVSYTFNPTVPIYGEYGNSLQAGLENIGVWGGFQARLHFWVRFDDDDRVKDIIFWVKYL